MIANDCSLAHGKTKRLSRLSVQPSVLDLTPPWGKKNFFARSGEQGRQQQITLVALVAGFSLWLLWLLWSSFRIIVGSPPLGNLAHCPAPGSIEFCSIEGDIWGIGTIWLSACMEARNGVPP